MQKPLAVCQGKTVPGAVLLVAVGLSVRGGPPRPPRRRETSEADGGWLAAPDPGKSGRRCSIGAGLESEGRHLVLPVADAQREVVQGAANDGVGAIIQRLQRRYMAVSLHEHGRCAGEVVGKLRRQTAAVLCLVAECSAALSVLENCPRKVLEERFW